MTTVTTTRTPSGHTRGMDHTLPPDAVEALVGLAATTAAAHHCPSLTWGVVADGRLVASGSCGARDDGELPTSDTVYRIASMTKSFTAATVLALRDEGVVRLDDPVTVHAPELAGFRGPTTDAPAITIGDLLSMGSGLATDDVWADRHLDLTDDELDTIAATGACFAQPTGTAFEYSNLGFAILGRVVRNATGTRVQDQVATRFLGPLGMSRTTWVRPEHDDWARPYRWQDDAPLPELPPVADGELAPMGGIWSTVSDLARWVEFLGDAFPARDGLDDGPLCRASRREMQQLRRYAGLRTIADVTAPNGYGYGLLLRDDPTLGTVCGHSGGLPGYGSNMRWIVDRRIGVIALANVTYAPMAELTMRMLYALDTAGALPPASVRPVPHALDTAVRRLVSLLHEWDAGTAAALFADNVDLDEPSARRRAAVERLVGDGRPLALDTITATTDAAAVARLTTADGRALELAVELAPLRPVRIESWELSAAPEPSAG